MNTLGIIPARYHSTRLEGKPLIDLNGKPMIQRVYEQANKVLEHVFVATDDERIEKAVKDFNGKVILTKKQHSTGTSRCAEACKLILQETDIAFDYIVNIQGDEPMLSEKQLKQLINCFDTGKPEMVTLAIKVTDLQDLENESECFIVLNSNNEALYFSRYPIPFLMNIPKKERLQHHTYFKHVGLYAFTPSALQKFASMPESKLEKAESLEQNRWLEADGKIKVALTDIESVPVDTEFDVIRVRKLLNS